MITAIVVVGLLFRLFSINQGLWLDEAIGAIAARDYSYWGIITEFLTYDNHPPLYYLLLKLWSSVFGYSDISLRLPGVLLGVFCVYLTWKLTKTFAPRVHFLPALFVALNPFLIYYSQEVRMYMLNTAFAILLIFSFLKTLEKKTTWRSWVVFAISLVGLMFTDYVPVFLLPVIPIYAWISKANKNWWRKAAIASLPLIVLGILWIPIFKAQILGGVSVVTALPGWKDLAGGATFKSLALVWMKFILGRISIQPKTLYYGLVFLFSVPILFSLYKSVSNSGRDSFIRLVWLWLLVPLITAFMASTVFPAFNYFRLTFVVPAFLIILSHGILNVKNKIMQNILLLTIMGSSFVGLYFYNTQSYQKREAWREAVQFVESDGNADSIALFEFPDSFAPYRWYSDGTVKGVGALSEISGNKEIDTPIILDKISSVRRIYYFEYLADLTNPTRFTIEAIEKSGFTLTRQNGDFRGVGIISVWEK